MGVSDISDVFVSYRRVDVDFVKQVVEELQGTGREVWIDWEDIPPGSVGFSDDIKRGIEGADAFLAILSPDYLESPFCVDMELNYAIQLNKKLVPIVYRKFDGYDVPAGISHINWIYFTPHAGHENTFEVSFPKVIEVLETDLEHQRTHKRFLMRAIEWDEHNRANSFLLTGDEIIQAETWLANSAGKEPFPSDLQKDYVATSRSQASARQRALLTGVSGALVLTVILAIVAVFQWRAATIAKEDAENQRTIAVREAEESASLALASGAREINISNQIEAVGLALEAVNLVDPPALSQRVLGEVAYQPGAIQIYPGHVEDTSSVAVSPDGMYIAVGAENGLIIIWDSESAEEIHRLEQHEDEVVTLEFSPDNSLLAAGSGDGTITVWDVASGELLQTLEGHERDVRAVAFHPDGTQLASGSVDSLVIVWDVATGDIVQQIEAPGRVFAVDYHTDGTMIAIGDRDGVITLVDTENYEVIATLEEHTDDVNDLEFIPGTNRFMSAASDLQILMWDTESASVIGRYSGHSRLIRTVTISPDGRFFMSGGDDRTIVLRSVATGEELFRYTGVERVSDLVFMPDSVRFVSADESNNPILWAVESGAQIASYDDGDWQVLNVAVSPDGQRIATGSQGAYVHIYDLASDEEPLRVELNQNSVTGVAFNVDGTQVTSVDASGGIFTWDAVTGEVIYDLTQDSVPLQAVAYSPDGQFLAVGGGVQRTSALYIFNAETGELIHTLEGHIGTVRGLAFGADSTTLAAGEEGNQIILWNVETGEMIHTLEGHSNAVYSVAFSPDGTQVASASFDNSIILWDAASGDMIQQFFGHTDVVRAVTFSADGEHLISAGSGAIVLVWDINDRSQIVGQLPVPGITGRAARFDPAGAVFPLGPLPFSLSVASAINGGAVAGGYTDAADGSIHATLWNAAGAATDLGSLGGSSAFTVFVNARGEAAGQALDPVVVLEVQVGLHQVHAGIRGQGVVRVQGQELAQVQDRFEDQADPIPSRRGEVGILSRGLRAAEQLVGQGQARLDHRRQVRILTPQAVEQVEAAGQRDRVAPELGLACQPRQACDGVPGRAHARPPAPPSDAGTRYW